MTTPTYLNQLPSTNPTLLYILIIWSLLWKGLALWKSARKNQKWWFIVILLVNTLGFLEILYLFVFSREKKEPSPKIVSLKKTSEKKEEMEEGKKNENENEDEDKND